MELEELKQGLNGLQDAGPSPDSEQPWLNMDNLMGSYGGWFGQDKGLGELLLGQLRARGVDTQAATEAMLRELLTTLVDDLNMLQQRLTGFTQAVAQQMHEVNAVKDSVDTALAQSGGTPASQDVGGELGAGIGGAETPLEAPSAGGEEPPAAPEGGETPPEEPAPEESAAAPEEPPASEEEPVPEEMPEGTLSDKRAKKVKGCVLSDAGMKKVIGTVSKSRGLSGFKFMPEMVAATRRF